MKHYFLQILDPEDSFTRNTIGNDLTLCELKEIAEERTKYNIKWESKFDSDIIVGWIHYEDPQMRCQYAEIQFH